MLTSSEKLITLGLEAVAGVSSELRIALRRLPAPLSAELLT
jgi:hypothetical protein